MTQKKKQSDFVLLSVRLYKTDTSPNLGCTLM